MVEKYAFPFDIHKTYYQAIGEVIARMALVEFQVMLVIGHLLKLKNPKQVRVSFMGMTMKARLGAIKSLASNWAPTPQIKQELCSIVSEISKLTAIRNSFAHGMWGRKANSQKLHVTFAKEGKDFYLPKSKHYTSAEIVAKAKEVRAVSKRLLRAIEKLQV